MAKEYIEREAALKGLEDSGIGFYDDEPIQTRNSALKIIQNIPAADVVPVVRGRWKATDAYMTDECENCGFLMNWDDVPLWLVDMPYFNRTCPNCGAIMDADMREKTNAMP